MYYFRKPSKYSRTCLLLLPFSLTDLKYEIFLGEIKVPLVADANDINRELWNYSLNESSFTIFELTQHAGTRLYVLKEEHHDVSFSIQFVSLLIGILVRKRHVSINKCQFSFSRLPSLPVLRITHFSKCICIESAHGVYNIFFFFFKMIFKVWQLRFGIPCI